MRLSLSELLRFLESTPESRNVVEGKKVHDAGHIIMYGMKENDGQLCLIFALCLQSSALSSHPHELTIKLNLQDEIKVVEAKCSCKGGVNEKCKHISGFLWICMASTDLSCYWKFKQISKVKDYELAKIQSLECYKTSKSIPAIIIEEEIVCRIKNDFANLETSAYAQHR